MNKESKKGNASAMTPAPSNAVDLGNREIELNGIHSVDH